MEIIKKYKIMRINEGHKTREEDAVVVEYPFTIIAEGKEIITLFCTPKSLKELAIGFLYSEGWIQGIADIASIQIDEKRGMANIEFSKEKKQALALEAGNSEPPRLGSSKGTKFNQLKESLLSKTIKEPLPIDEQKLIGFMKTFTHNSKLFGETGGVHSCGLYDYEGMIFFEDDIGRHNAYDKVFGRALDQGVDVRDKMILTSGRISSEMLIKAAKREVPMIVSKSAPMSLAIEMAQDLGITLIGFVRGDRMNIYTNIPD